MSGNSASSAMKRTQCPPCPWRDMDTMRAEFPEVVEHAKTNPEGFVCHARCGPCPGPTLARVTEGVMA